MNTQLPPLGPLPEPDLEDHEYELWGQNVKGDFFGPGKMQSYALAHGEQCARAAVAAQPMVDMVPPATARDRWMYEQGRLAERDPRTPPAVEARVPEGAVLAGWLREWEGDDSDIGQWVFAATEDEKDNSPNWREVYWLSATPAAPQAEPQEGRSCKVGGPCVPGAISACACSELPATQPPAQQASAQGEQAQQASAQPTQAAKDDKATPGPWFVRKLERGGELVDCFVAAPDRNGFAYDAEILGDDEYRDGIERKLADCELIIAAVNSYRASNTGQEKSS